MHIIYACSVGADFDNAWYNMRDIFVFGSPWSQPKASFGYSGHHDQGLKIQQILLKFDESRPDRSGPRFF
jgi:hypothetical protein